MARVLVQDLKRAANQRLADPHTRPALLVLDEFAALDDPVQVTDLLRQAREARMATVVSTQHLPDAVSAYALRAALLGAGLLIAHRVGHDDAQAVANVIGTESATEVTRQVEEGANTGRSSARRVDRYVVNPNVIKQLPTGQAVVLSVVGERRVARITVPAAGGGAMTDLDDEPVPPPPPPRAPAVTPAPSTAGVLDLGFVEDLSRGRPPQYATAWAWLGAGMRRQGRAALVALLAGWSGLWLVLWLAALGAVIGAIAGAWSAVNVSTAVAGSGQAAGILSIIGGFVGGAVYGVYAALVLVVFDQPLQLLVALLSGAVVSAAILAVMIAAEPLTLKLRGYRRTSRRERERLVPLLKGAAARLGLPGVPPVLIADDGTRNAYACLRHLVVTRPLFDELGDEPLPAILAHELHHWACADVLGQRFVFACAWPLAILYNAGAWLARGNHGILRLLGWVILWPAYVLTRFVVQPMVFARSRQQEYECDAAARAAGYGPALREALSYLGDFEAGRSGWEQVIAATHPPTELRLEALG